MKNTLMLILSLCWISVSFSQTNNPVANPAAIVTFGNARFTVLTPEVIRMEWSEDAKFTDNASLTFVNRNLEVPQFSQKASKSSIEIKTQKLTLIYKSLTDSFSVKNLSVTFMMEGKPVKWIPGVVNKGNLFGTTRTLDGCGGNLLYNRQTQKDDTISLEKGIISRDGWVLIDDSKRPLFDNSDWAWVKSREAKKQQDLYFFGYGTDYKNALADYTKIGGHIAMPPKFAFGSWWSRYWEYTDKELRELVNEFETYNVPLDVFVIDMDWHLVDKPEWFDKDGKRKKDQAEQNFGWTGFTWNKDYFPNPDKFLQWTNEKNLQTCLNLHPASGIQPHEEQYPAMAKAMGIDPASQKYVPFDITDKKFATNYMDLILHPMEKAGIDFWWLDWQQWGGTKIPGVNPTFYLNYVHYSDMERQNKVRPLIFHRWGGLGNQRYQIGFSGDTKISWKSLAYQPYFTSTAANVGFGYWSHDIGGHMGGISSPELYTRWIQWGAFSPIMRTHCSKDPKIERRIWAYPTENFKAMRNAYLQRYALIPYLYSQARVAYETGISICHPLYYDYPKEENAYAFSNQYMFGNDMLLSPIVKPIGADSLFASQKIWLPEGNWYELYSGTILKGNQIVDRPFTIDEVPVYVKEGAIIPMQPRMNRVDEKKLNTLILSVYPGKSGATTLYEDEGNNNNFKQNAFVKTEISFAKTGNTTTVIVNPAKGTYPGMVQERSFELRFPCSFPAKTVKVNGKVVDFNENATKNSWNYNGDELTTVVFTSDYAVNQKTIVEVEFMEGDITQLSGKKGQFADLMKAVKLASNVRLNKANYDFQEMVRISQSGTAITYNPSSIQTEITSFNTRYKNVIELLGKAAKEKKEYKQVLDLLNAKSK
jgi:alpha-glucosidase (family GH31 glycosyl hydrolase)